MVPLLRRAMTGMTSLQTRNMEKKLVSKTCLAKSIVWSITGPNPGIPAAYDVHISGLNKMHLRLTVINDNVDYSFLVDNVLYYALDFLVFSHIEN
jgi:hypothetical protein